MVNNIRMLIVFLCDMFVKDSITFNDVSINFFFWTCFLFFFLRLFYLSAWYLCLFSLCLLSALINLSDKKSLTWVGVIQKQPPERCSERKGVLKDFAIFTGRHLCWSLFLITLKVFRPVFLSKRNFNKDAFL